MIVSIRGSLGTIFAVACAVIVNCALANAAQAEVIRSFTADVRLEKDCTLDVMETIDMDFEDANRHGIYRTIPVRYHRHGAAYTTDLILKSIVDDTGTAYKFKKVDHGNDVNIKIGDPDVTISGRHIYRIHYQVRRAVNFFSNAPEVYWNVTGNDWPFPIEKVAVTFYPPEAVPISEIRAACYRGAIGSTDAGEVSKEAKDIFFATKALAPGEGFTIVTGLPVGSVVAPTAAQEAWWLLRDWWPLAAIPALVSGLLFWKWARSGRDIDGGKPAAVEWNPPKDLTPAEVGTLIDEYCHTQDIVATLIDLAARGYLKIKQLPNDGFLFFSTKDYLFTKLDNPPADPPLNEFERYFLDGIFPRKSDTTTKLSELKFAFYTHIPKLRDDIYESLTDRSYFTGNPNSVRWTYLAIGIGLMALGFVFMAMAADADTAPTGGGLLLSGIISCLAANAMPARTAKGSQALRECLGFQRFVKMAEKDRIRVLAKEDPTMFGRLLPYAMVLGVADEWATAFQDLIQEPPRWYEPYGCYEPGYVFSSRHFVGDLGSGMYTMEKTLTAAPSSSSSGGGGGYSGFGGGGFSGGGFGGGGGGSW